MSQTQQVISGALVASGFEHCFLYDWFLNKIPSFELTYAVGTFAFEEVQANLGFI